MHASTKLQSRDAKALGFVVLAFLLLLKIVIHIAHLEPKHLRSCICIFFQLLLDLFLGYIEYLKKIVSIIHMRLWDHCVLLQQYQLEIKCNGGSITVVILSLSPCLMAV